jgi:hypothetical protein
MILSIAAVIFAVGGALATTSSNESTMAIVNVAVTGDASCTLVGTCNNATTSNLCKNGAGIQLKVKSGLTCPSNAVGNFTAK